MGKTKVNRRQTKQEQREGIQFLADQANFRGLALAVALDRLGCTLYVTDADAARLAGRKVDHQRTADGHALRLVDVAPAERPSAVQQSNSVAP